MNETKKILIVDDEPDVLTFLSTFFGDNGFETLTALDGKEAVRLSVEAKPDLITLDLSMPEKSGVKAYREIKENPLTASIPVVMVTAIGEEQKRFLEGRHQIPKPEGYLTKPIDTDELLKLVRGLLA